MRTISQAQLDALFEISGHLAEISGHLKASRDQEALMHDTGRFRREAQIAALRWMERHDNLDRCEAIRRLENGGEL